MYGKKQIFEQLEAMGAPRDGVVLIHSSLRAVGETEGRGEGLLSALIEYFTHGGGLLCIPTHTWANIGKERVTLDLLCPKTCIGTLPDIAAGHPLAHRSLHPTHSMAVFGDAEKAESFISDDERAITPAPPFGCYGKIHDMGGHILLIGVKHNRNTYIHCVEEMLGIPNRLTPEPLELSVRHKDGKVEKRLSCGHRAEGIGDVSLRYVKYEPAFRHYGHIKDGFIGNAPVQLCDARGMKQVVELIYKRSGGIELLSDFLPLEPALYI
ncbi:MAG: AAC(3) family N-acetyltransferase [Clostridia bacterium]|nr:AAC(3) family N-acetyltransferase [Clostridia bacterium]